MVEGGKIDWACHSNDGATMVNEVMDFSGCSGSCLGILPPTSGRNAGYRDCRS